MYEGGPRYFRNLNRRPSITLLLKILGNVSSSGSSDGIVTSRHRRNTAKGKVSDYFEHLTYLLTYLLHGAESFLRS